MAHRLILLMVLGLGAMYMLHLLAQDWNTIQRPAKRSLTRLLINAATQEHFKNLNNRTKRQYNYNENNKNHYSFTKNHNNHNNMSINWKRILSRDPLQCLESLICQLVAYTEREYSSDAIILCNFLEANIKMLPEKITNAYNVGLIYHGYPKRCFNEYPMCWYSAKTMLKILKWFTTEPSSKLSTNTL